MTRQKTRTTQNTTTHTPGPWTIDATNPPEIYIQAELCGDGVLSEAGIFTVAMLTEGFSPDKSQERANARLIAAAPEMRAELANLAVWLIAPDTSHATLRALQDSIRALLARIDGQEDR